MSSNQIDLRGQLRAFPYVRPYVFDPGEKSEKEKIKLQDFIDSLSEINSGIPSDLFDQEDTDADVIGTDEWKSVSLSVLMDPISKITAGLQPSLDALNVIISQLGKILEIIELFISGFNSFSKLILSAINLAQNKLNEFTDDAMKFGVYTNVICPPALFQKSSGVMDLMNKLRGGFPGFLTKLESSIEDPKDKERPIFSTNDYVGGLVIMLDTQSLSDMWVGLSQMAAIFDFMGGFGLNMRPPPPANIQGFCGFFPDPDADEDEAEPVYGVQLEWDQTYTATGFNIYRSRVPGDKIIPIHEPYLPRTLQDDKETGELGLLSIISTWFLNIFKSDEDDEPIPLPERDVKLYNDPDFNGGKPIYVEAGVSPSLKYTDLEIKTKEKVVEDVTLQLPYYVDKNKKEVTVYNYYYIIKACGTKGGFEGPYSKEVVVALKSCNDAFKLAKIIEHPNGRFEFFAAGVGELNSWSSIQINTMIPWFGEAVKYLNKFLDSLKGMVTGASDSFSKFIKQITGKIQMYMQLLGVITWFIERLIEFKLGPSISFLNVTPEKGGMPVFVERIRGAQPPNDEEFSGPNGINISVVMVYGASGSQIALVYALKKSFEFIYKFFTD